MPSIPRNLLRRKANDEDDDAPHFGADAPRRRRYSQPIAQHNDDVARRDDVHGKHESTGRHRRHAPSNEEGRDAHHRSSKSHGARAHRQHRQEPVAPSNLVSNGPDPRGHTSYDASTKKRHDVPDGPAPKDPSQLNSYLAKWDSPNSNSSKGSRSTRRSSRRGSGGAKIENQRYDTSYSDDEEAVAARGGAGEDAGGLMAKFKGMVNLKIKGGA